MHRCVMFSFCSFNNEVNDFTYLLSLSINFNKKRKGKSKKRCIEKTKSIEILLQSFANKRNAISNYNRSHESLI